MGAANRASTRVFTASPEQKAGEQRSAVLNLTTVSVLADGEHRAKVSQISSGCTSKTVIGIASTMVTCSFGPAVEGPRVVVGVIAVGCVVTVVLVSVVTSGVVSDVEVGMSVVISQSTPGGHDEE